MERRVLAEESPLRVLLLAELGSIHSYRWAKALAAKGVEVAIFSRSWGGEERYRQAGIRIYSAGIVPGGLISKVQYVLSVRKVRQAIRDFKPHILHAHYAATYGILGAFAGKHPYVVSVWGGDVYDFPLKGWLHRWVIKHVFRKADRLLSTSHVMAKRAAAYTNKRFTITPFGVDLQTFTVNRRGGVVYDLIGTVKALTPKYGIDVLIRAFALCVARNPARELHLQIAGDGPERKALEQLAETLGIAERVQFLGFVENGELPTLYSRFLVAVFPSVLASESFGVVAVEAAACACPVVASDADGFTETVADGETGLIVPMHNVEKTAQAIQHFIDHPEERKRMGQNGRKRAESLYNWDENVATMLGVYQEVWNDARAINADRYHCAN